MAGKWMVTRARKMTPNREAVTLVYHASGDAAYDASVSYAHARVKPHSESYQETGSSLERASITLFQEGSPSVSPYSGAKIIDADGREWLIELVRSKHQWEDSWGVHNCECSRVPRSSEV